MGTAGLAAGPGTGMGEITVSVTLFADLRRFAPRGRADKQACALPEGATVADLLEAVGIPSAHEITVGIGGELAQRETVLRDGDEVLLFSPMAGG